MKAQPDRKYRKSAEDFFFKRRVRMKRKVPKRTAGAWLDTNRH
jgi:hypothetical protein